MKLFLILIIVSFNLLAYDAFITPSQLKSSLKNKNTIVIDVAKYKIYTKGHIKGAIHSDISDFIDKDSPYNLMKSSQDIQDEIQELGINIDSNVIIYAHNTQNGILHASYLAFALTTHGFENISILDGGYMSWVFQNEFLTSTESSKPKGDGNFIVKSTNHSIDIQTLKDTLTQYTIIDARSPEAYYGIVLSRNIDVAGHIPKSKNSFYLYNFLTDSSLRIQKELDAIYRDGYELSNNDNIVVYSDNIFSASMEFYILYNHMEFKNTKIYESGLLEWSNDLKLPMTRFKWE